MAPQWPCRTAIVSLLVSVLAGALGCASQGKVEVVPRPARPPVTQESVEWLNRGLAVQGNLEEEARCYSQAIRSDPSNGEAHNNLGVVHLERGEYYTAAQHFAAAGRLLPEAPQPAYNLGLLLEQAGKPEQAAEQYERATALAPGELAYKECLARALIRCGGAKSRVRALLQECLELEVRPEWVSWIKTELRQVEDRRNLSD